MKNVRQVTKTFNPKTLACWTLPQLNENLAQFLYETYDTIEHPALGQTPREAYRSGMESSGARTHRLIAYDDDFMIFTLPTTPKGKATVVAGRGVKIRYLFYWADAFRDPQVEGKKVAVRYDPFDAGTAYAYVKNRWVRCTSEHYRYFQGHSEKEIQIATAELHKTGRRFGQQLKITARRLADLLVASEETEVLLRQRLKDAEAKEALGMTKPTGLALSVVDGADLTSKRERNPKAVSPVPEVDQSKLDDYEDF
jgi:hypothetical protein